MEKEKKVLEIMQRARIPLDVCKIVALTGLQKKEVDQVMKRLRKNGLIVSFNMSHWRLSL